MKNNGDDVRGISSRNNNNFRLLNFLLWKRLPARLLHKLGKGRFRQIATANTQPFSAAEGIGVETFHLSELSRAFLEAQEQDRERIATDLHDSIGQNLSAVKMTVESVLRDLNSDDSKVEGQQRALTSALSRLRVTIDELRRIALDLRPSMLEELGLLPTLKWCCREFEECYPNLKISKRIEVVEEDVPPALRCDIYRLIQEALHNVIKHSSAENVDVVLQREDENLLLSIADDGCGFDVQKTKGSGIGLYSMRTRSERGGGSMQIASTPEVGTRIIATWPLTPYRDKDGGLGRQIERRVRDRRRGLMRSR